MRTIAHPSPMPYDFFCPQQVGIGHPSGAVVRHPVREPVQLPQQARGRGRQRPAARAVIRVRMARPVSGHDAALLAWPPGGAPDVRAAGGRAGGRVELGQCIVAMGMLPVAVAPTFDPGSLRSRRPPTNLHKRYVYLNDPGHKNDQENTSRRRHPTVYGNTTCPLYLVDIGIAANRALHAPCIILVVSTVTSISAHFN